MVHGIFNSAVGRETARMWTWIILAFFGLVLAFAPNAPFLRITAWGWQSPILRIFGAFILLLAIDIKRNAF